MGRSWRSESISHFSNSKPCNRRCVDWCVVDLMVISRSYVGTSYKYTLNGDKYWSENDHSLIGVNAMNICNTSCRLPAQNACSFHYYYCGWCQFRFIYRTLLMLLTEGAFANEFGSKILHNEMKELHAEFDGCISMWNGSAKENWEQQYVCGWRCHLDAVGGAQFGERNAISI